MVQSAFVDISSAITARGRVSVVGVVVDAMSVFQTRTSSFCVTFTLKDSNLDNGHTWDGLKVKYFHDFENSLPSFNVGDVVSLNNVQITVFNGKKIGVASQQESVPWAVFPRSQTLTSADQITFVSGPIPFDPTVSEKRNAKDLLQRTSSHKSFRSPPPSQFDTFQVVQSADPNRKSDRRKRFSLIKDVEERMYVDLVCEVVKTYGNDAEKVIIYVTDYTAHEALPDYGHDDEHGREGDPHNYLTSKRKSKGPPRMSLSVTLWEPHASHARELKLGELVLLKNVHIKRGRVYGNLEASIHEDRQFPHKIGIIKVTAESDDRVGDLLARKKKHWKESGSRNDIQNEIENPNGPTKSKKKKTAQKQEKEAKREEGQKPINLKRVQANNNIKAADPGIPCRSVEDIFSNESHEIKSPEGVSYRLPFQNLSYRATVRVVDFFPPNLEDFAVPQDSTRTASSSQEEPLSSHPTRWEWRFCLLVENGQAPPQGQPKEQMKLFVSGPDAECLLGIDPCDLRRDEGRLNELQEKLFHIWGNLLEERSNEATGKPVSSVPFTCCIKEYGVQCTHENGPNIMVDSGLPCSYEDCFGWERRFAMFQTTIRDSE